MSAATGTKRELNALEAAALSVSIMAPTAAMALNGSLAAGVAGTAVALSFLIAVVTIGLVSYAFTQFARRYASAGSVYTFNGRALGARAGFLSGWALLLTYLCFSIASAGEVGLFFQTFVELLGGSVPWLLPALVALALIALLAVRRISLSTNVTVVVETISIVAILVLAVLIVAKVGAHGLTLKPFAPGDAGASNIALASVFAFLSFAGFEGAAVLGEETRSPTVAIPRAIKWAVYGVGLFYLIAIYVQAVGFGLMKSGVDAFAGSSSPLADLAQKYANTTVAVIITGGAVVSALVSVLGTVTGASRLMLTFGRDRLLPSGLARVDTSTGSPRVAVAVTVVIAVVGDVVLFCLGVSAANVFGYLGTVGVLSLLLVYLATQVGAIRLFGRERVWRPWQFAVPVIAIGALGYTLYANVYPVPSSPLDVFPYLVLAWLVIGVIVSVALPSRMRAVAADLTRDG